MGRFSGRREWEECYHGWDLADAIKDLGFVRSTARRWSRNLISGSMTRRCGRSTTSRAHLRSPLTLLRAMSPADRETSLAEYRKGFKINPCH